MTRIGPAVGALRQASPEVRPAAIAAIAAMREAVRPYHGEAGVVMPASVWVVTAVNG